MRPILYEQSYLNFNQETPSSGSRSLRLLRMIIRKENVN